MVNDGTYVILSALNTARALDCVGGSDNNGANVRIYDRSDGDSQLVHITTNSDGSRRLIFALSGKSIDVTGGTFADGKNIQQYTDNATDAQKWNLVDAGSTVTVDGTALELYKIQNATNTGYVLDVSGGSAASGTNVQIHADNGTSAQKWALVAKNAIPTGTYLIRSALDSNAVIDVSSGSLAMGANVQLYGSNDTNAQIWRIEEYDSTGLCVIYNTKSGLCLNVDGNISEDGRNVLQWENDGTSACKWLIEPNGTTTRNGVTVPTYRIHFMTGSGKVIDAAGGKTTPKTNVQIWTSNDSAAQKWDFEPYSMLSESLPVPASISAGTSSGASSGTSIPANGITSIYPSWICDGTDYQCRYRIRSRKTGEDISDFGNWMSVADGTTANDGWGDIGSANVTTADGTRKYCTAAITVPEIGSTYDYAEVQVEVRRYESAYQGTAGLHAHGNSTTQTIKLVYKPTLTISNAYWTPDGLQIPYASDYKRGGNTIKVISIKDSSSESMCDRFVSMGMPYSGSVTIPFDGIKAVSGTSCTVDMEIITDQYHAETTASITIQYDTSHGITVTPSYKLGDGWSVIATVAKHTTDSCYLWTGEEFASCDIEEETDTTRVFRIYPPFNQKYSVFIVSEDSSGWGTSVDVLDNMMCHWYVWNWEDECAIIGYGKEDPPSATHNATPDSSKQITTGRKYPTLGFSESKEYDLSVDGAFIDDLVEYSNRKQFKKLEDAHHAIFRNPDGEWFRTGITGVSFSHRYEGYGEVSVKQEAESL